jgi:hypothetical protein
MPASTPSQGETPHQSDRIEDVYAPMPKKTAFPSETWPQ